MNLKKNKNYFDGHRKNQTDLKRKQKITMEVNYKTNKIHFVWGECLPERKINK